MGVSSSKGVATLAVVALVATGCGSRLSEDQVTAYAGAGDGVRNVASGGGGGPAGGAPAGGAGAAGTGDPGGAPDAGATTGFGDGPAGGSGADGGGDGGADADTSGSKAEGGSDGRGGDGGQGGSDTRAAPAGGNGGATDVGVTEDTITVYNISDLSGAVPGLFRDAMLATQAYFSYFAATEGTVYGRSIEFVSRDSQMSSNGNRAAYLDACESALAVVGSLSVFEEGAVEPIKGCGVPDIRVTRSSKALQETPQSRGVLALRVGEIGMGEWSWYAEQFPEAVKKAAYVFQDVQTTRFQTSQNRSATKRIGYEWIANIAVAVSETNYARIVTELERAGAEFVTFQGSYQHAVRLVEAMDQQSFTPTAYHLQGNVYSPDFLELCGSTCNDFTYVGHTAAMLEEIDDNPELQTYRDWLQRVSPGARPTAMGMYAWGAARLFVQGLKEVGPEPTRAKLLDWLGTVDGYTANDLFPPQHVGTQEAASCIVMLDIEDEQFVRIAPERGYRCVPPGKV